MPLKGTSPCVIGTLADIKSGRAQVTAAGLQRKDFYEDRDTGKLVTRAVFLKNLAQAIRGERWEVAYQESTGHGRFWKTAPRKEKAANPLIPQDTKDAVEALDFADKDWAR